jgi:hypothetical protein
MYGEKINTLLTAGIGNMGVVIASSAELPTPAEVQSIGQLIIQAIIAIVTVWKLVKKPKPTQKNDSQDQN